MIVLVKAQVSESEEDGAVAAERGVPVGQILLWRAPGEHLHHSVVSGRKGDVGLSDEDMHTVHIVE